jgi:serine/threonine protein kinase
MPSTQPEASVAKIQPDQPAEAGLNPSPPQEPLFVPPMPGEAITSELTRNTYTIGPKIGEGSFGEVFACADGWRNDLAAKVLKPLKRYEEVKASAIAELQKLYLLRHPYITYFFDAFEYRNTFYIITERCYCPLEDLFKKDWFHGQQWLMAVARCLLQAVNFTHLNELAHQDIHMGNVFASFAKDEMVPGEPGAIQFKLGDLGVAKVFSEIDATNTRAQWMLPPEVIDTSEFGPLDHRIDIYHCGLLFLQLGLSRELRFTPEETRAGKPREMALQLPPPLNFALEKALRRHVPNRTASAMELWRDLNSPAQAELGETVQAQQPMMIESGPASPPHVQAGDVPGESQEPK